MKVEAGDVNDDRRFSQKYAGCLIDQWGALGLEYFYISGITG